jgi:hypothetical protein
MGAPAVQLRLPPSWDEAMGARHGRGGGQQQQQPQQPQ